MVYGLQLEISGYSVWFKVWGDQRARGAALGHLVHVPCHHLLSHAKHVHFQLQFDLI